MIIVQVSEQVGQDLEQFVIGRPRAHLRAIYAMQRIPIDTFGIEKGVFAVKGLPEVLERRLGRLRLWRRFLCLDSCAKAHPTLKQA